MTDSPLTLSAVVVLAGLLPFAMVMLTSFVKMAVVLSIVRSAIGAPQVPPNSVVTGLALVLTMTVMSPVVLEVGEQVEQDLDIYSNSDPREMFLALGRASQPLRSFLVGQCHQEQLGRMQIMLDEESQSDVQPAWRALVPAFVISQLQDAFQLGFIIFLPFLVLDMLVASVLLSLGMHMLSPTTISLPFKLLLFSMADGWTLLGESLLGSFIQV